MISSSAFVADIVAEHALKFGEYTLKSGIQSPYFFDLGAMASGRALHKLGFAFAQKIHDLHFSPDIVFGPAYKGIPLVACTAIALLDFGLKVHVAYDRKERKQHGEQGVLVGSALQGRDVLVLDDVITDGASKIEACKLIQSFGGNPVAVVIALDRCERDPLTDRSHLVTVEEQLGIGIYSIASVIDILEYLATKRDLAPEHTRLADYIQDYCVV